MGIVDEGGGTKGRDGLEERKRGNSQKIIKRRYENKGMRIKESEKASSPRDIKSRSPGLCNQCSATELRQLDNHQPSKSSICTAQVVLHALVAHLAATQHLCRQNSIRREHMLSI